MPQPPRRTARVPAVNAASARVPAPPARPASAESAAPAARAAPPAGLQRIGGEWFLDGTAPGPWPAAAAAPRAFGITHPRDGTVLALDPDIPPQAQRLVFSGAPGQWWLDGRLLGQGSEWAWTPRPGRHVLELRGAQGQRLGRVQFTVRDGAPRVAAAGGR
jgi:penicillin-binding protein 1C